MKKVIVSVILLFPLALLAQTAFTINGKVGKLEAPAIIYLRYSGEENKQVVDSAVFSKGTFKFKGAVTSPRMAVLSIKRTPADTVRSRAADIFLFYLENASMTITAEDSIKKAMVKGSRVNDDNKALTAALKPTRDQINILRAEWIGIKKDSVNAQAYNKAADSLKGYVKEEKEIYSKFIASHTDSYIALVSFRNMEMDYNFDPVAAEMKFNKFSAALRSSALGKSTAEKIETTKRTMVGVPAMDFTQNDVNGKPVKLSDYKGKYVLVDFWASWCKPCRMENPNLIAAYSKYKDKNFTILGVSLDDERAKTSWLKAIEKDGVTWTQVSDLLGWKNSAAQLYSISAIPSNFLVDPSGKIIARNLRGEELNKKLSEILN